MKEMNKQIVRLAVPSILANITIPLVGLVDTAIVGHVGNAIAIGGIAIGTMLFDLLYWNFGFLRVGTSGMTAQAYGRGDKHETSRLLKQSLSIALLAAGVIWLVQWLFVTAVLAVVPCSEEVATIAREYFFARIWAAPATLCLMAFKGWFIGMQDTRSPMAVDILVNVVNMIASYILAVHTSLGVVGVAWGTVIAQYTGLILAFSILLLRYTIQWRENEPLWSGTRKFMQLNGNIFIRSLCFMVVYVGFTSIAGSYGDTELAVSSIIMKLFMFFSFFVDGFAYAGEALVGKYWGKSSTNDLVRWLIIWGIAMGLVFTLVYAIWGDNIIWLMTDDRAVLAVSRQYLIWLILMPLASSLAFIWDGIYVGATAGKEIRNAMIYAALSFAVVYAVGYSWWGIQALYMAYSVHLIVRAMYLRVKWKKVYVQEVRE